MSHTKTFDCDGCRPYCYGGYHMREDADGDGDYVLAEDFNRVKKQRDELLAVETNLRQQVAHMTDQLAGEKSNVELANRQRDELIKALEHILEGSLSLPRFAEEQARAIIASVRKSQGKVSTTDY